MVRPAPLAALAALAALLGRADALPAQARLRPYVEVGIQRPALGDVRDVCRGTANAYLSMGVPVPIQREFPSGPLLGVGVTRQMWEGNAVGIGADYTRTRAFALYGDSTGNLDLTSSVSVLTVVAFWRFEPFRAGRLGASGEVRAGIARAAFDLVETIGLEPALGHSTSTLTGSGTAITLEGAYEVSYKFGRWQASVTAGYRWAEVGSPTGRVVTDGQAGDSGDLGFGVNGSGPVFRLRLTRIR